MGQGWRWGEGSLVTLAKHVGGNNVTVARLYDKYGITVVPEYVSLQAFVPKIDLVKMLAAALQPRKKRLTFVCSGSWHRGTEGKSVVPMDP